MLPSYDLDDVFLRYRPIPLIFISIFSVIIIMTP